MVADQPGRYRFDELAMDGGGTIGLGCCPGHRLTPWMVRPELGSLQEDLAAIAGWGPDLVLTLMEARELDHVGVPAALIGRHMQASARRWVHLPIPNLREPDHRLEAAWPLLYQDIDRALKSGGRIFIHCYAGLGRTGTVAARILIERHGLSAAHAIALVRATRPGSVETMQQERYLFALHRRPQD